MKTNITRLLCLMLALLLCFGLFTACGEEQSREEEEKESPTDVTTNVESAPKPGALAPVIVRPNLDAPYTIVPNAQGQTVIILVPQGSSTAMQVAENTPVATFLTCVLPKEGFEIALWNTAGEQVVNVNMVITNGFRFEVVESATKQVKETMSILVVKQETINSTVQQQEQIDQHNSQVQNSTPVGSTPVGSTPVVSTPVPSTPVAAKFSVSLASVWSNDYSQSHWQSTLNTMKTAQGITTNFVSLDANSATDTIVKGVMAGKTGADVYEVSLNMCRNIARKKAAANIYDSNTLDKSKFNCGATQSVTFNGKAYGVTFASKSVNPMGVIYNKDLIKKYAPDYDLQALYKAKKWTFDAFQTLAKKCTHDTDGNGKSDIYGFTSNTNIIAMAISANAGGTALMNGSGRVEPTMCNNAGVAALEWCKTMFKTDKSWLFKADINSSVEEFAGGKAAMFVSYLAFFKNIASKADFQMGFVLMPMGPAQSNYINSVYDASLYVVPKTSENRLDDIGQWLNGIAGVSNSLLNSNLSTLAKNGLDANGQDIYKWLVNNMSAEFSTGAFTSNISSQVDSSVTSASKSPTKVMPAIKAQAQKELDDFYGPLY